MITIVSYGEGLEGEPVGYVGASADGSKVLFETPSKLAGVPGALKEKEKPNLYLWDRDTREVGLAGVLNSGDPPPAGAFGGPYDWNFAGSADDGGAEAGYYTQDQHVFSADGNSVYFTAAASGELYLRRNVSQAQSPTDGEGKCTNPALACTVQVSASQKDNGEGPGGTDPAGPRPAALMEAGQDGSFAFLTSSEKLTNDANTGPEVEPPAIALAKKIDGGEKNFHFLFGDAAGLASDATHVYWADPVADAIGRAKLDGSEVEKDFITGADNPQYVAVDATHVYWTNAADGQVSTGTIGRAKLGASEAEEIDQGFIEGATNPQGIDAEGEFIYWGNGGSTDATRTIGRAKLGASEAEEIDQGFIEVGGDFQKLTPQGIAVNATRIYMAIKGAADFSYLFSFDIGGDPGSRQIIPSAEMGENDRGVTLDSTYVYWARQGADSIARAKLDFKEPNLDFIGAAGHPIGITATANDLLWSANQESPSNPGNDLYRYDANTGKLSDVAPKPGGNGAEVVGVLGASADGTTVYFAANGDLDGGGGGEAGDCEKAEGSFDYTGQCGLYVVREGEEPEFVAELDAGGGDASDWAARSALLNVPLKTARVSADGQTLLFRSKNQLTAYPNEGTPEFYRYHQGEGISCVSCNPTGEAPAGPATLGGIRLETVAPVEWSFTLSRNLSEDGNRVFFETPDALVGADTNGLGGCPFVGPEQGKYQICLDAYEWEAAGTGSCPVDEAGGGCIYLLSSGKSQDASYIFDASASGDDVFIATRSPFVRQDQDQLYDVY
ncbi:MAG TPA: hypothetical protein VN758_07460, partial [Solirubrobacterales bacterium]|nr:hypothetical protein [Solirubrobacterales bacterium]